MSLRFLPETGDVLLWHWESFLPGGIIAAVEGNPRSHAAICIVLSGVPFQIGAEGSGVIMRPLENDVRLGSDIKVRRIRPALGSNYPCGPRGHTPRRDGLGIGWQRQLAEYALGCVGVLGYSDSDLVANLWRQLLTPDWAPEDAAEGMPARVMCSQFVTLLLRKFRRYPVVPGVPAASVSPGDLDETSYLETVCERLELTAE